MICLLQYVKSVHRTRREHRGGACTPASTADSQLAAVKEALARARGGPQGSPRRRRLPHSHARRGRLGAPAQRHQPEARRRRTGSTPRCCRRSGSRSPSHTLFDTKTFKAGLAIHGREVIERRHDVPGPPRRGREGVRRRSQPSCARAASRSASTSSGPSRSTDAIDRETVELFRSQGDARAQGARDARARTTPALIAEETRPSAPPQRRASPSAQAPRASRAASTSAATTAAPTTAPSTSARPPPRCSARCCPRSSTASRRPPPRRRT